MTIIAQPVKGTDIDTEFAGGNTLSSHTASGNGIPTSAPIKFSDFEGKFNQITYAQGIGYYNSNNLYAPCYAFTVDMTSVVSGYFNLNLVLDINTNLSDTLRVDGAIRYGNTPGGSQFGTSTLYQQGTTFRYLESGGKSYYNIPIYFSAAFGAGAYVTSAQNFYVSYYLTYVRRMNISGGATNYYPSYIDTNVLTTGSGTAYMVNIS